MNICIFGDSIAYGYQDLEKGGWANRLRLYLDDSDYYAETYNLGISGDNSEGLLARFEEESFFRSPDLVIFAIGINDSQDWIRENRKAVELDKFEENIRKLMELSRARNYKMLFVGPTPVDENRTGPISWNLNVKYDNRSIEKYNDKIREICEEEDLKFIDLFYYFIEQDYEKLLPDGVHPDSFGHELIARKIIDEAGPFFVGE